MKNKKRYISIFLAVIIMIQLLFSQRVFAEECVDTTQVHSEDDPKQWAYDMPIDSNAWEGWPQGPATYGEADIVMDASTGAILYAKNIDGKAYPASITKILTMLIALENGNLDDTITISRDAVYCVEYGYAHIGLTPDEQITLRDALYAVMLASANEAAYAVADNVGESYDWFIQRMNERCQELGAVNSNFHNTNGMEDPEHYTTARDMALITQELLKHPEFEEICQTLQYTIPPTNLCGESRTFQQNHKMFYDYHKNYDPSVIAGKTGFTDVAKNTLVTCAERDGVRLICVALKTHGTNVYNDTENLLSYGYDNFDKIMLHDLETCENIGKMDEDAYILVPKGVEFHDLSMELIPSEDDKSEGFASYTYQGNSVGQVPVEFSKTYLINNTPSILNPDQENSNDGKANDCRKEVMPPWAQLFLICIIVLIFILIIWLIILAIIHRHKKAVRRKKARQRQKEIERRKAAKAKQHKKKRNRRD